MNELPMLDEVDRKLVRVNRRLSSLLARNAAIGAYENIYILATDTSKAPYNTGIQRIVRQLGVAISGYTYHPLHYVVVDETGLGLRLANNREAEHLSRWNGPRFARTRTRSQELSGWLIVPELLYPWVSGLQRPDQLFEIAKRQGMKTLAIFHDNIPFLIRDHPSCGAHKVYIKSLKHADLVVSISEWVARDLLDYSYYATDFYADLLNKLHVLRWPIQFLPGQSSISAMHDKSQENKKIPDEEFALYVGSSAIHKNIMGLIGAFDMFVKLNPSSLLKLVIAGHAALTNQSILDLFPSSSDRILLIESPEDSLLSELYIQCRFTVTCSLEEGYALPVAESLALKKPVLSYDIGAISEIDSLLNGGIRLEKTGHMEGMANGFRDLSTIDNFFSVPEIPFGTHPIPSCWNDYVHRLCSLMLEGVTCSMKNMHHPRPPLEFLSRNINLDHETLNQSVASMSR